MTDNQSYRVSRSGRDDRSAATPYPHDAMTVVAKRYPGRWVTTGVFALLLILMIHSVVMNDNFAWQVVGRYLFSPIILNGLWVTLWLTVVIMLLAIVLGVAIAAMRLASNPLLAWCSGGYIWFFRGTPVLVQPGGALSPGHPRYSAPVYAVSGQYERFNYPLYGGDPGTRTQ